MPLVPGPAGAPAVAGPGFPTPARMKMRMGVIMSVEPDPAVVPLPVAADPGVVDPRRKRHALDDRLGRLLRCDHLKRLPRGRRRGLGKHGVVALDPDPSVAADDPLAGNPCRAGLHDPVPAPADPFPALMVPRPVSADPDVAGPGFRRDDLEPRGGRLAADDAFGAAAAGSDRGRRDPGGRARPEPGEGGWAACTAAEGGRAALRCFRHFAGQAGRSSG